MFMYSHKKSPTLERHHQEQNGYKKYNRRAEEVEEWYQEGIK
jgi:hypothetical protein